MFRERRATPAVILPNAGFLAHGQAAPIQPPAPGSPWDPGQVLSPPGTAAHTLEQE